MIEWIWHPSLLVRRRGVGGDSWGGTVADSLWVRNSGGKPWPQRVNASCQRRQACENGRRGGRKEREETVVVREDDLDHLMITVALSIPTTSSMHSIK